MRPERWQKIEEIFNEALELSDAERDDFIRESTGDDENLAADIRKLIDQFDAASSFIEEPAYENARTGFLSALLDDDDEDPMVGKVLGSYRIEREIGRGGMGAVYEASRADGEFRLKVALKVVKRGVDTDFVLKRFRNERQILAALHHPYITRLIDGGSTEDGRPYFVMEYIDGYPLYRYCDRNRLGLNERLRLFCRVCEAVEYAHQKLVIHRDLKPSNIFITNDGSPRLLDFGIAKLLDPGLAVDTLQPTATALRMMTVDYASPEQIRGEKVTFGTDIYSLGVVLFELATGFRPYRVKHRASHEVARAICDEEPFLVSEVLRDAGAAFAVNVNAAAPTLSNSFTPDRAGGPDLSREAEHDLDAIIAKAMKKSPADRYASVAELRQDIERHLDGEPVSVDVSEVHSRHEARRSAVRGPQVAVLPLSSMSPNTGDTDTSESYLMIGLADAIITRLTSVGRLTVRPTSSITRYHEHYVNPFRAGRELGVDYVLDGRIRRFGDRLRISLQLLDVNAFAAIWAGHFDEHLTDVLELEDAISEQVATAMIPHLTGEDRERLAKRGTNSPEAYEHFLKGRFYWQQFTNASLAKAFESYQKAVEIDPEYALAHAAVAEFYVWGCIYGIIENEIAFENAERSIRRALQLDNGLGEAYATMGLVVLNRFEYEKCEVLYRKAIELSPSYPLTYEWYAALLIGTGRPEEGYIRLEQAMELDPLSLRSKILFIWYLYQAGNFEKALMLAEEVIELDPNFPQGHLQYGYNLAEFGRYEEAVVEMERASELMPGSDLADAHRAMVYRSAGRISEAGEIADALESAARERYVKPMFLFFACIAAERLEKAFEYLSIGIDTKDPWLLWLGTDAKMKWLHNDPRFAAAMKRTLRTIKNGRVHTIEDTSLSDTSIKLSEAVTEPLSEAPTGPPPNPRRFARTAVAAGILGIALIVVIGLFSAGYLSVTFLDLRTDARQGNVRSLAVLPFENATGDPANDYIAEGMSDSLIARLSRSPDVRIVPRSASYAFKNRNVETAAVGRELLSDYVIKGRLDSSTGAFVLNVEMIRVSDGQRTLSLGMSDDAEQIYALQDKVVDKVGEALGLGSIARSNAPRSYTDNNEAFQLYLKGEYNRQKATPAGIMESIGDYERAIALDPDYALAHQGLSLAYRSAPAYGVMPPAEAMPKAKSAAERALSIDPGMSAAYISLAAIKNIYEWDFAGAEQEYKRAIQIAPHNAEAQFSYGNFLVSMGRADEGLDHFRAAQQLDPLSLNIQTNIGWANYIAGRYGEAETQIRQVLARDPNFARGYMNLGEILQEQRKFDESIAAFRKARDLSKDPIVDMALGHVYADAGRRKEAEQIASELEAKVMRKEVSPFLPAIVYSGLNEKDRAFYWLERAFQDRSNWLTLLKVGHRTKNLRSDPRFDDLLKRIGFPN